VPATIAPTSGKRGLSRASLPGTIKHIYVAWVARKPVKLTRWLTVGARKVKAQQRTDQRARAARFDPVTSRRNFTRYVPRAKERRGREAAEERDTRDTPVIFAPRVNSLRAAEDPPSDSGVVRREVTCCRAPVAPQPGCSSRGLITRRQFPLDRLIGPHSVSDASRFARFFSHALRLKSRSLLSGFLKEDREI